MPKTPVKHRDEQRIVLSKKTSDFSSLYYWLIHSTGIVTAG